MIYSRQSVQRRDLYIPLTGAFLPPQLDERLLADGLGSLPGRAPKAAPIHVQLSF